MWLVVRSWRHVIYNAALCRGGRDTSFICPEEKQIADNPHSSSTSHCYLPCVALCTLIKCICRIVFWDSGSWVKAVEGSYVQNRQSNRQSMHLTFVHIGPPPIEIPAATVPIPYVSLKGLYLWDILCSLYISFLFSIFMLTTWGKLKLQLFRLGFICDHCDVCALFCTIQFCA